jgi:predicted nucleic acid-binding protein
MGRLDADELAIGSVVLVDSAPLIYLFDENPEFAGRYQRLLDRIQNQEIFAAISAITLAEVIFRPVALGEETVVKRMRAFLEQWQCVSVDLDIAESAARLRVLYKLKIPDALQLAIAVSIGADAIITNDKDFASVKGIRVLY